MMVFVVIINLLVLNLQFINGENRIVGGYVAQEGDFPYQISMRNPKSHICGGSILNEKWILTAAHCVRGQKPANVIIVTGTNSLTKGGDRYEVENLIPHPSYSPRTISNDIALIKLKEAIRYTKKVRAVKLTSEDTAEGEELVLSGWGRTSYPGNASNNLQAIKLTSISNDECKSQHEVREVTPTNICTFTKKGEGACHGDSGGPLVQGEHQVGVVSWGTPCAIGKPDVFTRVYSYLDWIEENIKQQ